MLAEGDAISCRDSLPSLYTVNSNINPPYARNAEDAPQIGFAKEASGWRPLNEDIPDCPGEDDERYSQAEEKLSHMPVSLLARLQGTSVELNAQGDMGPRRCCSEAEQWERRARCQSLGALSARQLLAV